VGTDFEGFVSVEPCTEWDPMLGGSGVVMVQDVGRRGVKGGRAGRRIVGRRAHVAHIL
jgi:hypothetical protein